MPGVHFNPSMQKVEQLYNVLLENKRVYRAFEDVSKFVRKKTPMQANLTLGTLQDGRQILSFHQPNLIDRNKEDVFTAIFDKDGNWLMDRSKEFDICTGTPVWLGREGALMKKSYYKMKDTMTTITDYLTHTKKEGNRFDRVINHHSYGKPVRLETKGPCDKEPTIFEKASDNWFNVDNGQAVYPSRTDGKPVTMLSDSDFGYLFRMRGISEPF